MLLPDMTLPSTVEVIPLRSPKNIEEQAAVGGRETKQLKVGQRLYYTPTYNIPTFIPNGLLHMAANIDRLRSTRNQGGRSSFLEWSGHRKYHWATRMARER